MKEVIARIAEKKVDVGATQRIWNHIINALRKIGLVRNDISVSEIHDLIAKSAENLNTRGGKRKHTQTRERKASAEILARRKAAPVPEEFESRYDTPEQEAMAAKVGSIRDDRSLPQKLIDKWNNDLKPYYYKRVEQAILDL